MTEYRIGDRVLAISPQECGYVPATIVGHSDDYAQQESYWVKFEGVAGKRLRYPYELKPVAPPPERESDT
ncbi:MAG: hypothetical protein ACYTAO_22820 [Planctomycetota bacterium]|jgi:hypothetical protein